MELVQVREAALGDGAAIVALSGELGYHVSLMEVAANLDAIAASGSQEVLVAEVSSPGEGEVVGWIEIAEALRVESGRFGEITGLVVTTAWRGRGVGRALVDAASSWCRARGLTSLRVRCNVTRADAHRFYLQLGFDVAKTQKVFSLPLP